MPIYKDDQLNAVVIGVGWSDVETVPMHFGGEGDPVFPAIGFAVAGSRKTESESAPYIIVFKDLKSMESLIEQLRSYKAYHEANPL